MNQLTDIDISNNMSLERLNCFSNEISALDISNHAAIYSLNCSSNMMTTLTFNNTPALRSLSCDINQLTNLELNNNLALTDLACFDNQLTSLDLSANIALIGLECDSNLLTELNVQNGNNTNFNFFSATNNPNLTCIQVDDAGYSTTNWNSIDGMVFFSENCATASIEEYQSDKVISYPNPVLNQVTIKSKVSYSNYEIYDYTGKQVKKGIFKGSNINLAYLDSGIYMLKLIDDLNYETVKLIKK